MIPDRIYLRVAVLFFALAAACLSFLNCAPSMTGKVLDAGIVGSAYADYATTKAALDSGRGVEANPLMQHQAAMKIGSAAGMIALADWVERSGRPRVAHVIRLIPTVTWSSIAWHNHRVMR